MGDAGNGENLRGKYLDWCSARVAERFLALSPEEIYDLARPASESGAGPAPFQPGSESYRVLVQRATESLLERLTLPTFEDWAHAYAKAPERYDEEMLGFWKDLSGGGA